MTLRKVTEVFLFVYFSIDKFNHFFCCKSANTYNTTLALLWCPQLASTRRELEDAQSQNATLKSEITSLHEQLDEAQRQPHGKGIVVSETGVVVAAALAVTAIGYIAMLHRKQ